MSRRPGKFRRVMSRIFKERQIYHRSDGVVHFISMSAKTQIALAVLLGACLLWVAYASVNVVFKEQIIVAKERDYRVMETNYSKRIHDKQDAFDDVASLLYTVQKETDSTLDEISARHQALRTLIERKSESSQQVAALADALSDAGDPSGQKSLSSNRVMIDLQDSEPTPRQSRNTTISKDAAAEAAQLRSIDAPEGSDAAEALSSLEQSAANIYEEQILLASMLEVSAREEAAELRKVISATGVKPEDIIRPAKIANVAIAQGGPFIELTETDAPESVFFQTVVRAAKAVDELENLQRAVKRLPISSPLIVSRRFTSPFGIRRDPINGRVSRHHGIDFAAAWRSPITATGDGVIKFAGSRSGFGRTVEIDHGNGFMTRYAHLNRISVKSGQKVKLHDKVGELGSSGRSTGPHVHYEILFKGKPLNPQRFIEAGRYVFES